MNAIRIDDSGAYLILRNKQGQVVGEAALDLTDLPRLQELNRTWSLNSSNGYVNTWGWNSAGTRRTTLYLHRFLVDAPAGKRVDHIDHDLLNNRRANLRIVTASQNNQNQLTAAPRSVTGVRNVSYKPGSSKPYMVRLQLDKRSLRFGRYRTLAEAERVAIEARRTHFTHAPENLPERGTFAD